MFFTERYASLMVAFLLFDMALPRPMNVVCHASPVILGLMVAQPAQFATCHHWLPRSQ